MDELEGGWNGNFKSVNFYDYSSIHPSVIKPSNILGGTTMSLKFEMVDDILTEDARDEMTDKFSADTDFIKSGVMALVAITMKPKYNLYANDSSKVFDIIAEISDQLDEMWEVYADLGYAYSTLLEKYQEATKETE